jgi:curved DNA-binding protein
MPVDIQDYYKTLGVGRDASAADIKKAFRKLARKYHPDVAKDKASAEEQFKAINEAYEVLGDPEKRQKYDDLGADWNNPNAAHFQQSAWQGGDEEFRFSGTGFSDFFEQYFGGGAHYRSADGFAGAGAGSVARRGQDIEGDILVTLEEAMQGAVRPIAMQMVNRQTGKTENTTFHVRIPKGVQDGQRIRVPGHGGSGTGGAPDGDLYLRVRHAAHPEFTTQKSDIYHEVLIAPWEAVLGGKKEITTLDGKLTIRIPAGAEQGQQLRIRQRGLPKGKSGDRGDFFVVLNMETPSAKNAEQRGLWEKLRDSYSESTNSNT